MNSAFTLDFDLPYSALLQTIIKQELIKYINKNLKSNDQLKINVYLKDKYKINWSCSSILLFMCNHINVLKDQNTYILEIDKNINIPNTDHKLVQIIKLINYGNLEFKGIGVIKDAFEYIASNINDILMTKMM